MRKIITLILLTISLLNFSCKGNNSIEQETGMVDELSLKISVENQEMNIDDGVMCNYALKLNKKLKLLKFVSQESIKPNSALYNMQFEVIDTSTSKILNSKMISGNVYYPKYAEFYEYFEKDHIFEGKFDLSKIVEIEKNKTYKVRAIYNSRDISELMGYERIEDAWYGKVISNTLTIHVK